MLEPRGVHVGLEPGRARVPVRESERMRTVEVEQISMDESTVAALAVADGYTRYRMLHWTP